MAKQVSLPTLVIRRDDVRGGRFAVSLPYLVEGKTIIISDVVAFAGSQMLQAEANDRFGEPVFPKPQNGRHGPRPRKRHA